MSRVETWVTEVTDEDGRIWAGPDVEAKTWEEADAIARRTGHRVIGSMYLPIVPELKWFDRWTWFFFGVAVANAAHLIVGWIW